MISFRQLLVTLLVIALVWGFYRARQRFSELRAQRSRQRAARVAYQDTVRCPQCGLYLPRKDATAAPVCDNPDCPIPRN